MKYYYEQQDADFLRAALSGSRPLIDGEEARRTVEIFTAIYRSNRDHKPVKFPLQPEHASDFDGRLI
jgi:predicted dehydrogenase